MRFFVNHNASRLLAVQAAKFMQETSLGRPCKSKALPSMENPSRSSWKPIYLQTEGSIQSRLRVSKVNPIELYLVKYGSICASVAALMEKSLKGHGTSRAPIELAN